MTNIFRETPRSYLLVAAFGILAGLLVVFFMVLPDSSLWSFYFWSSGTFGFWAFSTSLIVLFSESKKCAAINAGIYIFLMFFITTARQSLLVFHSGGTQFGSLSELTVNSIGGWLAYSIPPALACAALGVILWHGRLQSALGKTLRLLPAVFMLSETAVLFYSVLARHIKLFPALSDLACFLGYLTILSRRASGK